MRLIPLEIESRLRENGMWPESRTAQVGAYVLALDLLFFVVQKLSGPLLPSITGSLSGWVSFLSGLAIFLFAIVGFRWLRSKMLWRLRNRLIVTYVFIGVIPVILLVVMSSGILYLLAGQFANFVVTSEITAHLRGMEAANRSISMELATQFGRGERRDVDAIARMRSPNAYWTRREVCAWYGNDTSPICSGPTGAHVPEMTQGGQRDFREIVRDENSLYLRAATLVKLKSGSLYVVSSEPLDKLFLDKIAKDLGEITLFRAPVLATAGSALPQQPEQRVNSANAQSETRISNDNRLLIAEFSAGAVPAQSSMFDFPVTFGTPLPVVDWTTVSRGAQAAGDSFRLRVETRPSVLYERLFASLGDFAKGVEYMLLFIAVVFGVIELLALFIGTRLTRSITSAVAQLYEATKHINRADFSHRIQVKSTDQLATLANSFNSMTASIEKLVLDQKEKQRLENELVIAQEVQATLFPQKIAQLESLEVHGFCRPARTVSGDYYDFLALNSERLILAVGDVSGKGISAALLMATIHSAVRAYSLEGMPQSREAVAVGVVGGVDVMAAREVVGAENSPGNLLGLLNHQLYESTPQEKYATLFLAMYDGTSRRLTYSNGGHLPPILLSKDGSSQLLTCGGTVTGLFADVQYPEATVQLAHGDIFIGYSDGVTEPENDYGEFGEQRLIEIVHENRHLPLARITELVTAAVDDWIGDHEQPDDVTLVLARAR